MEIEDAKMPYREKIAWLSLIAMAVAFVPYFTFVGVASRSLSQSEQFGLLSFAAIGQALILGVGSQVLRFKSPEEACLPPDERDSAIMRRSVSSAYYVLMAGMILVGCVMPFNSGGWTIVHAAIFTIVLAEAVHYAIVVASYRRQA